MSSNAFLVVGTIILFYFSLDSKCPHRMPSTRKDLEASKPGPSPLLGVAKIWETMKAAPINPKSCQA